ncbi:23S rRNA (guanosine(2251)-2'-O)-methyltransferase RlmB [bacterium]|jgi:23S rRNA (guanosine2251-2'-O)-methyltransferase|nr:23S rRNA (guanosine(2251)-2'-O)-methyltransferase RlmB [bacterium]NBX72221.1 23S rRNA (guanosine(2251)-2'-O)-methyltransferase RlmB [bacterium]
MIELNITGLHAIEAALSSPYAKVLHLDCTEQSFNKLQDKALIHKRISIAIKPAHFFDHENKHQGIQAKVMLEVFAHLQELEFLHEAKTLLILDHLQDPQNLGSALRHALAFHVDAVIIPKHKAAPITSVVATASAGCLFKLPIVQVTSFIHTLQEIKKLGFGLIGTSVQKAQKLNSALFWPKSALIIGHEGKGSSQVVMNECDTLVHIPISSECQSLNAAVTAAIICYERAKLL